MDWQRDPKTGEWVVIDPMTQSTTGQEANPVLRDAPPLPPSSLPSSGEGYDTGDDGVYPVQSPQMAPGRSDEGGPLYYGSDMGLARPDDGAGYQNYDPSAYAAWEQAVEERGNEVRETAVGCFEVDSGGRIVSRSPSAYPLN
jgi:hypothetical protein